MGLFDGVPAPLGRSGSSADMAALLGLPVLIVHDCSGQAQSAAALLQGCATYDPRLRIAGVILNRIGSERHRRLVEQAVEAVGLTVFGSIPRSEGLSLPERHLGLVQAGETRDLDARIDAFADLVAKNVDLDAVRAAASAGVGPALDPHRVQQARVPPIGQNIAVARDAAFSFLYPHVLEGWRQAGAELHFFSPLADEAPPQGCDSCWLPGGYPELHRRAARAVADLHDGPARFRRNAAGARRMRRLHGAGPEPGRCRWPRPPDGRAAVRRDELRQAQAPPRLPGRAASGRLHASARPAPVCAVTSSITRRSSGEGSDAPFAEVTDAYGGAPAQAGSRRGNVTGSFFHVLAQG